MFKLFRNTVDRILANRRQKSTASTKECALTRGLRYEPLEARRMLATINVTTNIDLPVSTNDGVVSIRDAVAYINGTVNPGVLDRAAGGIVGDFGINDTIRFSALGGQPLLFSGGIINLFKPATIDGSISGGGRVVFTGGNSQSSVGLIYDGDATGRRLIVTDVEFRNFATTPALTVRTLGSNDSVRVVSSKFTGIGVAGSSEVAAIDIRDDFKGPNGILEIEGNEIFGNDHGIIYNDVTITGNEGTSPSFSIIGGNQFQDAVGDAGTSGNLNESIVLGKNVNRLLVRNNDFFSDGVAIEIDQPDLSTNQFVIIDGDNSFGTDSVPEPGVDLPFISDNRPVRVRHPEIQETLSEQLSATSWSVEYFQENTANAGLDLEVEVYHYNSGTKRWRKVGSDNLSSGIFPQSGYVFEEVTLSSGLLSPGDFIAAKTIDDESLVNGSAFGEVAVLDEIAPQIVDIKLRGSSWDSQTPSYSFRDAIFQGNQLLPVWYSGIDTVDVVFSGPVSGGNTSIFLTGSDGDLPGFATRTPDPDSDPRTWDYRYEYGGGFTLDSDKYRISNRTISGTRGALLTNPDSSKRLDGEWTNPTTPDDLSDDPTGINLVTGDENAGGDFRFHFAVLPGDYNGDGVVEASEGIILDGDGDGVIGDPDDIQLSIDNDGESLPLQATDGDYFDDEKVNSPDLDLWQIAYGSQVGDPLYDPRVDPDGNGIVDGGDFLFWQRQFGLESAWYIPMNVPAAATVGAAPQVMNVIISSSISNDPAYSFDQVDGWGKQIKTVPVGGADTVSITFSEDVNVDATSLFLVGLTTANVPNLVDFSYDPATLTASWQFDSWALADQYVISLSDSVTDSDGNNLDGEWTNPVSRGTFNSQVSTFPSGDGIAGGRFNFIATILPGDIDLNGVINPSDFNNTQYFTTLPGGNHLFQQGDYDGDGDTDADDLAFYSLGSPFGTNLRTVSILADLDDDGDVDASDLDVIVANAGLTNATYADGDLNGDGTVDIADLDLAYIQFGLELSLVS